MPIPLIVPIALGAAALFGLSNCSDEQTPVKPQPDAGRSDGEIKPDSQPDTLINQDGETPKNCGCVDQKQLASLQAYIKIVGAPAFQESAKFDAQGKLILTPGKPLIGMAAGDDDPFDVTKFTDVCGKTFKSPEEFYVNRLRQHQCLTGKRVAVGLTYIAYSYDKKWFAMPKEMLDAIHYAYCDDKSNCPEDKQVLPFLKIWPRDWNDTKYKTTNVYPAKELLKGTYLSQQTKQCQELKDLGYPVMVSLYSEANGNWDASSQSKPQDIAAATYNFYKLCVDKVGATNIIPVYSPNVWSPTACAIGNGPQNCPITSTDMYYPYPDASKGQTKDYIQAILPDLYNWGTSQKISEGKGWDSAWQTFDQVSYQTYEFLAKKHPGMPLGAGEIGSSSVGGNKPAWIIDAFGKSLKSPYNYSIFVWFNRSGGKETDWHLYNRPAQQSPLL